MTLTNHAVSRNDLCGTAQGSLFVCLLVCLLACLHACLLVRVCLLLSDSDMRASANAALHLALCTSYKLLSACCSVQVAQCMLLCARALCKSATACAAPRVLLCVCVLRASVSMKVDLCKCAVCSAPVAQRMLRAGALCERTRQIA